MPQSKNKLPKGIIIAIVLLLGPLTFWVLGIFISYLVGLIGIWIS